jgi:hypothetical protein
MILVRLRESESAEKPEMIAPTTAPIRSAPTNACCWKVLAPNSLVMNGREPEMMPVS